MPTNPFLNINQVNAIIKARRGPEVDRNAVVFDSGELLYTTDKKRMFVGDGINNVGTYGGTLVGNKSWATDNFQKLSAIEVGDTVYRTDTSAFYVLTASDYLLESNYTLVGGSKLISNSIVQTPSTSTSFGIKGQLSYDSAYMYICIDNNTWRRTTLSAW
jgi:hypothetical protein